MAVFDASLKKGIELGRRELGPLSGVVCEHDVLSHPTKAKVAEMLGLHRALGQAQRLGHDAAHWAPSAARRVLAMDRCSAWLAKWSVRSGISGDGSAQDTATVWSSTVTVQVASSL